MSRNRPSPQKHGGPRIHSFVHATDTKGTSEHRSSDEKLRDSDEIRESVPRVDRALFDGPSDQPLTLGHFRLGTKIVIGGATIVSAVSVFMWHASNVSTKVEHLQEVTKDTRQKTEKLNDESVKISTRIESLELRVRSIEGQQSHSKAKEQ